MRRLAVKKHSQNICTPVLPCKSDITNIVFLGEGGEERCHNQDNVQLEVCFRIHSQYENVPLKYGILFIGYTLLY
jgi:hypothetical protein